MRKVRSGEDASRDGFLCFRKLGVPITDQKHLVRHNNLLPSNICIPDCPVCLHIVYWNTSLLSCDSWGQFVILAEEIE